MISLGDIIRKTHPLLFWGMRGLPKAKRDAIYTLFAFCRHLSAVQHSDMPVNEKAELMSAWSEELNNIYDKKVPETNIGRKIYKNCLRFDLPKKLWQDILAAAELDAQFPLQAPSDEQFSRYVNGMAVVPFELALMILDNSHPKVNNELAKNLGYAVLMTYVLRDVKDDAKRGRMYIPRSLLTSVGIKADSPRSMVEDKNLSEAREKIAENTAKSYAKAERLLSKMNKQETLSLRIIFALSRSLFDVMNNRGWEIISPKPQLGLIKKIGIAYQLLFK